MAAIRSPGFLIMTPWPLLVITSAAALFCAGRVAAVEAPPAIFVFGDSILDTGNNNYLQTLGKCNFPPYGRNFPGGKPTGRFSDGKVISDLVAGDLGIKELLPPYLDPNLRAEDLSTGVAFASGGCGFDPETIKLLLALSVPDQIKLFNEYKGKLKGFVGEQRSDEIVNQSIYLISSGNNDIGITYFLTNRHLEYDMDSYATFLVTQASESLVELSKSGARKIGVFSTLVSGCVPEGRTVGGGKERECAESFNELARLYNGKLMTKIEYLNKHLPGVKMVFVDLFSPLLSIISDPKKYGFAIIKEGCCGTGNIEAAVLCNQLSPSTCANTSEYIFWDSVHPTEKTNRLLVSKVRNNINQLLSKSNVT